MLAMVRSSGWLGRGLATLAWVAVLVVGCAPAVQPPDDPAAAAVARTAEVAFHRMEIGRLQTGIYTTNVLIDVELASGTRWTLLEYPVDGTSYLLQFTSDAVPGLAWRVSPGGVRRVAFP